VVLTAHAATKAVLNARTGAYNCFDIDTALVPCRDVDSVTRMKPRLRVSDGLGRVTRVRFASCIIRCIRWITCISGVDVRKKRRSRRGHFRGPT